MSESKENKVSENVTKKKPTDSDTASVNQQLDDLANEYAAKYF